MVVVQGRQSLMAQLQGQEWPALEHVAPFMLRRSLSAVVGRV